MSKDKPVLVYNPRFLLQFNWKCPHCQSRVATTGVMPLGSFNTICASCQRDVAISVVLTNSK